MLTLTVYQAQIVPQQNAQTEFQHFEDVRNELIELRNAVSTAGQADVSQFPSVTLGTDYRTRTLTINPPDPAGTLRTSDPHNITISNRSGSYINISTRFIEYRPGYNEISIGSTWYEHSVLYLDERDRGGVSIIEEQNIVKDGEVTITAIQNQFQETDTGRVTLELYPRENVNRSAFPNGNLTVKVPTRLSESDWNSTLNYSGEIYNGVDPDDGKLNLSVSSTDLYVNTVGIREEPKEGSAKNVDPYAGDDSGDSGSSGGGGGGSGSDPSFATIVISDNSGGSGNSNKASYSISYTISDPDSNLENVTWKFTNTNRGETLLQGEGGVTGSDSGESGGGRFGESYQITVKLFSQSGEITSERIEITDTANADGIIYQYP